MPSLIRYGTDIAVSRIDSGWRVWCPHRDGWQETYLHVAESDSGFVLYRRLGRRPKKVTHGVVPYRMLGSSATLAGALGLARDCGHVGLADPSGSVQEMKRV